MRAVVREKPVWIISPDNAATRARSEQGDNLEGAWAELDASSRRGGVWAAAAVLTPVPVVPSGGRLCGTELDANAEPEPAAASGSVSPARARSIIRSKRTRTVTPCSAASVSTQARRSWSSRTPRTVDLEVTMAYKRYRVL